MSFILFLISLVVFFKTLGYAIYEIKQNKNIKGGISVIVLATISLFLPSIMSIFR